MKTLGAVLSVHGYPEDAYLQAAKTEFARTDVPLEQRRTHEKFLAQLTGTGKLTLDIVGHVGLPKGVALVVVQSFETGRVKLVTFTDGKPGRVLFAHISGTHIMPMTPAGKPFGMTWAEFAPDYEAWQGAGGQATVVITKRCLPDNLEWNAVTLHSAVRVGGSEPDFDDDDLMIELGVTERRITGVDAGENDDEDDVRDTAVMTAIHCELDALTAALTKVLGFNTSNARIAAVLSGAVKGSHDFWQPFPVVRQYYTARLRRQFLYVTHYDPSTVTFSDHVWTRSGSEKKPYPFPHLFRSLIHGLYEGGDQYAACLLVSVFHGHKLQRRQAAMLIALSLIHCSGYVASVAISDATKTKLVASIGSQIDDWCGDAAAKPIVLSHLVVQSVHEWTLRAAVDGRVHVQSMGVVAEPGP